MRHNNRSTRTLPVVSFAEVKLHQDLCMYLHRYLYALRESPPFPPYALDIINSVSNLCFVPCFLLAWTLARYNELQQISIHHIKSGLPFPIQSSKGSSVKFVPPLVPFDFVLLNSISYKTPLQVVGYDHLCGEIKRHRPGELSLLLRGHEDETHIFRHIYATHSFIQGVPINDISAALNHSQTSTTRGYIHCPSFAGLSAQR